MNGYDATLKLLLQKSGGGALLQLTGASVERWLNVELPRVQNPRVDLLGETHEGELIHLEFQSTNDLTMAHRMAEYYLAIHRLLKRYPKQTVVFVGAEPLRMTNRVDSPALAFQYRLVDVRSLDGQLLIESPNLGDNMLSILTSVPDQGEAVRRILSRIGECEADEREAALEQFLIIAGLRRLEPLIEQEIKKMPIQIDILENQVLGREYKKGIEQGIKEGIEQGVQQGELSLLRRQLQSRFGMLPVWVDVRLSRSSPSELELFGLRLLDPDMTLEDVFK